MVRTRPRTRLKLKRKKARNKMSALEASKIGVGPGTRKGHYADHYRRRRKRGQSV